MTRTCLSRPTVINVGPTRTYTTRQAAWNYVQERLDLCGQTLTFQCDNGTYTDDFTAVGPLLGGSESGIIFQGTYPDIDDTVINAPNMCFGAAEGACYTVQWFNLQSSGGSCIAAGPGSRIVFGAMDFGQTDLNHIMAWGIGLVEGNGSPYTISGGASAHYKLDSWGTIIINPTNISMPNACAFTYFCQAGTGNGCFKGLNFSGLGAGSGSTGAKHLVDEGATVLVGGAGAEYFPGYANSGQNSDGRYE